MSDHLFNDLEVFKTYSGDVSGSLISLLPLATVAGRTVAAAKLREHYSATGTGATPTQELNWRLLAECEPAVEQLFAPRTEQIEEFYGQVFVAGRFNAFSTILQCILIYMVWLLPIGSLLASLALIIAPLVFMWIGGSSTNVTALKAVFDKAIGDSTGPSRVIYLIGSIVVYLSAFWAQWQTAGRITRVVQNIRQQVLAISAYIKEIIGLGCKHVDALVKYVPELLLSGEQSDGTVSAAYWKLTQPEAIECLRDVRISVGNADVRHMIKSLLETGTVCQVKWSNKTCIRLRDAYHPAIKADHRITNNYTFVNDLHAIVTGPNRGGKSTMLKTIGINVLMANAFGIAFARKARLSHFDHIETYINLTDRNGLQSLFETELARCVNYLKRIEGLGPHSRSLLIMDEIFHSTNPVDGITAASRFIKRLHTTKPNQHISIITTHYKDLTAHAVNYCINSRVGPDGKIIYTYKLQKGTNFMSSVGELLDEVAL